MAGVTIPPKFGAGTGNLTIPGGKPGRSTIRDLIDNSAERGYAVLRVGANVAQGETITIGEAAAAASASSVQVVTYTDITGGSVAFRFAGAQTPHLAWNAAASAIQAAMQALPTVGSGNMTVAGSAGGPYTFTAAGALANQRVPLIEVDATELAGAADAGVAVNETTIGSTGVGYADVFVVDVIQTDSGAVTPAGSLNNTTPRVSLPLPAGVVAGSVILVGSELFRVSAVVNTADASGNPIAVGLLSRGYAGTTIAAHADGTAIYTSATPGAIAGAGHVPVPLTTALTPAAFVAAFTAVLRAHVAPGPSNRVTALAIGTAAVLIAATSRGTLSFALAETLAGSGNAWDTSTLQGTQPANNSRMFAGTHVVTAAEVTATVVVIPFDFAGVPGGYTVQLRTGAGIAKAWDGALTFTAPPGDPTPDVPAYASFAIGTSSAFAAGDQLCFIFVE